MAHYLSDGDKKLSLVHYYEQSYEESLLPLEYSTAANPEGMNLANS